MWEECFLKSQPSGNQASNTEEKEFLHGHWKSNTDDCSEEYWLFYYKWCHPGEGEAKAQKPELPCLPRVWGQGFEGIGEQTCGSAGSAHFNWRMEEVDLLQ